MGEVFQHSFCKIIEVSRVENIAIHLALVAFGCTGNGKYERCFYLPLMRDAFTCLRESLVLRFGLQIGRAHV